MGVNTRRQADRHQMRIDWYAATMPATNDEVADGNKGRDSAGGPPVLPSEAQSPGEPASGSATYPLGEWNIDRPPPGSNGQGDAGERGTDNQSELAAGPGRRTGDESDRGGPAGTEPSGGPLANDAVAVTARPLPSRRRAVAADVPERERNHRIGTELLAPAGQAGKIRANLAALELLAALEAEQRRPTAEERKSLAQYTGWGHSPQVFDELKADYWNSHVEGEYSYGHSHEPEALENWARQFYTHHLKLKQILTPEEWSRAEASTLNAHYTSREVIEHGLWAIAEHLGFDGGNVLENSAGIGHVLGLAPDGIAEFCTFTACELDSVSGRLLKMLYPQPTVHVMAFQDARIPPHSQDLVIGNFPFNKNGWSSDKYPFSLHNQFFARSLDLTAPGGLIVAITSDSTMDSPASAGFRRWMAQRASLVGAIRLPNNAFKKNAGTEVTTDILVFRKKDGGPFEHAEGFINTRPMETGKDVDGTAETVEVNEYYHHHPDMMLGRMTREGTMYEDNRPALIAHADQELIPQLQEAVRKLPAGIARAADIHLAYQSTDGLEAESTQKEGSYQIRQGQIFQVSGGALVQPDFGNDWLVQRQATKWIELRDAAKDLFARELDSRSSGEEVETSRRMLRGLYDAYVSAYGRVNKSSKAFLSDPEYSIPAALENESTERYQARLGSGKCVQRLRQVYVPADILSRRVLYPSRPPHRAESVADAATISRSWKGIYDLSYMGQLLGKTPDDVKQEIVAKELGFEDPASGQVVPTDEYLSGNVKEKLRVATDAAGESPRFAANVEALAAVQPRPLKIHEIKFSLGATWMPTRVVEGWLSHLFDRDGAARIARVPQTGRFLVQWDSRIREDAKNTDTYGGGGVPAKELIEDALNLKASIAYDEVLDPDTRKTKYVKNPERTAAAQDAQQKLKEDYFQWAKKSDFAPDIEAEYNEVRNAYRQRQWQPADFKHFPNAATTVELRLHQKTSVARNMVESNLMAHPVGSGKTYVYATTAMEWKRLGLATKPAIAVLKSTLGQVEEAFRRLYPQARLLVPHEKDFSRENRQKMLARIATGDYDAVILTHDNLNGIPDDPVRERNYITERIAGLVEAIRRSTEADKRETPTVKQLRQSKDRLEKRLHELHDRKTDNNLTFEQLGIDALIVDEAHMYKKLEFETQMDNIKGLDKGASQRSSGLIMKARYIQEATGGRNVVLGTGTPITNTVAEIWNMMRYVRPDLLDGYRVKNFDDFATAFTEPVTQLEQTDTGQYRHITRLARFTNLPELQTLFRSAADVVDADCLHIPKPALEGGAPKTITLPQTEHVQRYMQYLIRRYEAWNALTGRQKREQSHEPLVINGLAKKAALDMRLINPSLPDDQGSKLNRVVYETFQRWKAGMATRSVQVLFADSYQSPGSESIPDQLDAEGKPARRAIADDKRFNVFRDIKRKLIEMGVPDEEVQDIHDHDGDRRKILLFERVNKGEVRVIMGGTEKLGTGVNIQSRLKTLHHIDAPWRPSDMEQREGRILRQGNENPSVEILRYGVDRSFDANAYQRLDTKERFIKSIMNGRNTEREAEDVGAEAITSFADAFAAISGNPLVRERFDVETRIRHLERLQTQFEADQCQSRENLRRARSEAAAAERAAAEIRRQADVLLPAFADVENVRVLTADGTDEGKEQACQLLDGFIRKHVQEVSQRLATQLSFDRQIGDNRERRMTTPAPAVTINGVTIQVETQIQFRPADGLYSERTSDPEIRYSFRIGTVDLWKSAHVTTGRGFIESVCRKIAELPDDARYRDGVADSKRRQTVELAGLQDRAFTHADELDRQRRRLEKVKARLERSSNTDGTEPGNDELGNSDSPIGSQYAATPAFKAE
jgi:N12 class adenine-specific DNA methylase/adenine-specific DNA methylase